MPARARYTANPYVFAPPPAVKFMFELTLTDVAGATISAFERAVALGVQYLASDFLPGTTETPTL